MRPHPERLPDCDRRMVVRVAQQPFVRVDSNDYSIDPAFAGRRVEVRVSQSEAIALVLDTGELACRHHRSLAGGLTVTDPAHQAQLERADLEHAPPAPVTDHEHRALARDLPKLWHAPTASDRDRKELLRALVQEVVVTVHGPEVHAAVEIFWHKADAAGPAASAPRPATVAARATTSSASRRRADGPLIEA
jgi:hypothetical protein